jgi:hypothetical protein
VYATGHAYIFKLSHYHPAMLLGSELDVFPLGFKTQTRLALALGGYAVVGDNFHGGDSLRMVDDVTLQLFQRTFNQCKSNFTLATQAKKPALRWVDVLGKF